MGLSVNAKICLISSLIFKRERPFDKRVDRQEARFREVVEKRFSARSEYGNPLDLDDLLEAFDIERDDHDGLMTALERGWLDLSSGAREDNMLYHDDNSVKELETTIAELKTKIEFLEIQLDDLALTVSVMVKEAYESEQKASQD